MQLNNYTFPFLVLENYGYSYMMRRAQLPVVPKFVFDADAKIHAAKFSHYYIPY